MFDLIVCEKPMSFWLGGPKRKDFPGEHDDRIVKNPFVCAGSDELKGDPERPYDWYELQRRGAFPTFMNMYRKYGVPIEEIVRRNTSMVARHFGMTGRGELKEGYFADIACWTLTNTAFPMRTPLTTPNRSPWPAAPACSGQRTAALLDKRLIALIQAKFSKGRRL
jgi:hypothetical protein